MDWVVVSLAGAATFPLYETEMGADPRTIYLNDDADPRSIEVAGTDDPRSLEVGKSSDPKYAADLNDH